MLQFELFKNGEETGIVIDANNEKEAWNMLIKKNIKHIDNIDLIEV
jgi:hypothetical protein